MLNLRSFIRSLLRRDFHVNAVCVHPGDDLILSASNWPASEDIAGFLNAAQAQFPGVRIHLLTGLYSIKVARQEDRPDSDSATDDGGQHPGRTLTQLAADAAQAAPDTTQQGNVLLLRKLSSIGIVAVSVPIPPKQEGDSVEELHLYPCATENNIGNVRGAQLSLLAGDILRDARPDLFGSDDGPRLRRLLARKMRAAAAKFLANHKEVNHA